MSGAHAPKPRRGRGARSRAAPPTPTALRRQAESRLRHIASELGELVLRFSEKHLLKGYATAEATGRRVSAIKVAEEGTWSGGHAWRYRGVWIHQWR